MCNLKVIDIDDTILMNKSFVSFELISILNKEIKRLQYNENRTKDSLHNSEIIGIISIKSSGSGSVLDHRSLSPVFESGRGHI